MPERLDIASVLRAAAPELRKAVVGALLGGAPRWGTRNIGDAAVTISDFAEQWWVERRAQSLRSANVTVTTSGDGPLPLLAHVSGASLGALGASVLILLGLDLGTENLRQIGDFLDARLAARHARPGGAGTTAPAADFGGPRE